MIDGTTQTASEPLEFQLERRRGELTAYCYRMLGSAFEAEDAVQETFMRAWRGFDSFEGRAELSTWLYKIATNVCLSALAGMGRRARPIDLGPPGTADSPLGERLPEATWIEPIPDAHIAGAGGDPAATVEMRDSIRLAFVAALQHLPPNQRAVLILREVLGFSAREVAESLDTTVASVNSALQRARQTVGERLPEQSQQTTLRALGDEKIREVVEGYMDAMERGDVDAVVSMLAEDAAWSMPPLPAWFAGREALTGFLMRGPLSGDWRWRHLPARANGQLAVGSYCWYEEDGAYHPFALDVLTLEGTEIKAITSFITRSTNSRDPEFYLRYPEQPFDRSEAGAAFERFGLPDRLD